jgi:hypothetical protein
LERLVPFHGRELVELVEGVSVVFELAPQGHDLLKFGEAPHLTAGLLLIIPEVGGSAFQLDSTEFSFLLVDVKDAPGNRKPDDEGRRFGFRVRSRL